MARCARSWRSRCTTRPACSAPRSGSSAASTTVGELRERGARRGASTTRATASTPTSCRCSSSRRMLEMRRLPRHGALARQESRGAHTRLDFPERDDERWMRHTLAWCDGGEVRLDYKPVTVTRVRADGAELLDEGRYDVDYGGHAQDPALRRDGASHHDRDLHRRGARDGDAARRARRRQGQARRHARLPQVVPHGGLRLVRHAHGRRRRAGLQDGHEAVRRAPATCRRSRRWATCR